MIGRMAAPRPDIEMRTWRVHVPLGIAFGAMWLLTAFHLLVMMGHEVFRWDSRFILNCAAPPLSPVLIWHNGHPLAALFYGALLALVVAAWCLAAKRPDARWRTKAAFAVIVAYWIFHDFGLALAA